VRWLAVQPGPEWSIQDVYAGWVEALRGLGEQVFEYKLADRLIFFERAAMPVADSEYRKAITDPDHVIAAAIDGVYSDLYRLRPDVLLVVAGHFIPAKLLDLARLSGTRVVVLHTESPYEDERQVLLAGHADLNLVNDPTNIEAFKAVAPTVYMPHAYRPAVHRPGPASADLVSEFVFVGTGWPSRIEFFEAMNLEGVDVALAGNWQGLAEGSPLRKFVAHDIGECLDNADAVGLYQSSKVGLNLYRREAQHPTLIDGWAMGPREVELAACGLFFLREPRPEGDEVLGMLPTFTSPGEASELLHWWLAHDTERSAVAAQARAAIADRTFDAHAAMLMRLLEQHR
jgi:spore maturation protein CgeB